MEILVVGSDSNYKECQDKFSSNHKYQRATHSDARKYFKSEMIVFDFEPKDVSIYDRNDIVVFLNSTFSTLYQLTMNKDLKTSFFGFCGMNSFLNHDILELTTIEKTAVPELEQICLQLNTKFKIVEDKVGMVTPRIICMIINEAFFAIEQNVSSRSDIDLAMKLGTNYPFGPFEWCEKIGLKNVYQLLKAVHDSINDDRYRICKKLEEEALA
jgi:3-hydroxybutyryl-CoA dehydrogenase